MEYLTFLKPSIDSLNELFNAETMGFSNEDKEYYILKKDNNREIITVWVEDENMNEISPENFKSDESSNYTILFNVYSAKYDTDKSFEDGDINKVLELLKEIETIR